MARLLFLRMAGAAGVVALAFLLVGVDPFLSAGAVLTVPTPPVSVNRSLKGDRLMIAPQGRELGMPPSAQMPFACDPAFSQIFAPGASNVYGRCMS